MFDKIRGYIHNDEFKLTIFQNKIYATGYDNILTLTSSRIAFKIGDVMYVIKGEDLVLNKLLDREVLINGRISSLEVFYD